MGATDNRGADAALATDNRGAAAALATAGAERTIAAIATARGGPVGIVRVSGPAAAAGIARGDVILEMNKRPITSVADVKSVLDGSAGKPILFLITRRGQTIFLTMRPE